MPSFDDDVIDVGFYCLADLLLQACLNHALVWGAGILEPEGHGVEAEWPIWGNECCCGLVGFYNLNLMVSGVCIEETQSIMSCSCINNLVNAR